MTDHLLVEYQPMRTSIICMEPVLWGLIAAVQKYHPDRKASFKGYVRLRIKGAILDELRKSNRIPRSLYAKVVKLKQATVELEQKLGREASVSEITKQLGISQTEFYDISRAAKANSYLPLVSGVEDGPEHDFPDELDRTGRENMGASEKMQALMDSISALPQLQRDIIHMYYFQEVSLTEIGRHLGVSAANASLLHRQALSRLRLSQDEPLSNVEIIKITSKATKPKQSYRNLAEEALRRFEECQRLMPCNAH